MGFYRLLCYGIYAGELGEYVLLVELGEAGLNFVADAAVFAGDVFGAAYDMRWVIKADVETLLDVADEVGAAFVGAAADGDDVVPWQLKVLLYGIGVVMADVDANFCHMLDGACVEASCGLCACGAGIHVGVEAGEEAMRHLAAAAVACAEDKDIHV